jgi:hypothetical protein
MTRQDGREGAQIIYIHISKCKNDKIKGEKRERQIQK